MKDDIFTIYLSKDEVDLLSEVLNGVMKQCFGGRNPKDFPHPLSENNERAKSTFSLYTKIENLCK